MSVYIRIQNPTTAAESAIADSWIYLYKDNANISDVIRYRTDKDGQIFKTAGNAGENPDHSWIYTNPLKSNQLPANPVRIFYTNGALPLHNNILEKHLNSFIECRFDLKTEQEIELIDSDQTVSLSWPPPAVGKIQIAKMDIAILSPQQLTLWPVTWQNPSAQYYTDGINQGNAALWTSINAGGFEYSASAAPSAGVRPAETGLTIQGNIPVGATGVKIQVISAQGNPLNLKAAVNSTTPVTEIAGALQAPSGDIRTFTGTIFFLNAASCFGLVQIVVTPEGITPALTNSITTYLCGFQNALVNDTQSNQNGQVAGSVLNESTEVNVVDFLSSPQNSLNAITAQSRARRMITYQFNNRNRPFSATTATPVLKPEMPMFMIEFLICGMTKTAFENLMLLRNSLINSRPTTFDLSLSSSISLSWDGPDNGNSNGYSFSSTFAVANNLRARFTYDPASSQLSNVNAQGVITNGLLPAPSQIAFPVAGRRTPQIMVTGVSRNWGRQPGAQSIEAFKIEMQPSITQNNTEIVRGGDGELNCQVQIQDGSTTPQDIAIYIPRFRIRGLDPGQRNDVINAAVEERFNSHPGVQRITTLSLACWQETVRRLCGHETGNHHFETRGAGRRQYGTIYYGHEQDFALFGHPHGYGYGQIDHTPTVDDVVWSFFENIKESVRVAMEDKSTGAWNRLVTPAHPLPSPMTNHFRAIYRREIVRRYNGGTEFSWSNTNNRWEISPLTPQARMNYCNDVLGTNVQYYNAAGNPNFPMEFTATMYGPGI